MSLIFLNEEVEEFASKRSQSFVNVRSSGWLFDAKKSLSLVYEAKTSYIFMFFIRTW